MLYPDKFKALVTKIEGIEKVVYQKDGGFKVIFKVVLAAFDFSITQAILQKAY
jgi:hypothetical protein